MLTSFGLLSSKNLIVLNSVQSKGYFQVFLFFLVALLGD